MKVEHKISDIWQTEKLIAICCQLKFFTNNSATSLELNQWEQRNKTDSNMTQNRSHPWFFLLFFFFTLNN